jgi:AraC-like DNA-binding protein
MTIELSIISLIYFAVIVAGLSVSIILWNFPKEQSISNKILAIVMYSILWQLLINLLVETKMILQIPHLYRTGHVSSLVFMPMAYFYVRSTVTKKAFRSSDFIHGLPLLFYLVDYSPFFTMGTREKSNAILNDLSTPFDINRYDEGWFTPRWFHVVSAYTLMGCYWVFQLRMEYKEYFVKKRARLQQHKFLRNWLFVFTGMQAFAFLPVILSYNERQGELQWLVILASIASPIAFATLWLLFQPEILYGLKFKARQETSEVSATSDSKQPLTTGRNYHLSGSAVQSTPTLNNELLLSLNKVMLENKKFLQHKYSINDLAIDLNMSSHQLSYFLNEHLQVSFPDFLNKYRIEHCISRIKKGDAQRFTLEGLGFECGFNNRNSFRDAFKRFTGSTPSEYIRLVNLGNP